MSLKDFLREPIEMVLERHDALGGVVEHLMGHIHIFRDELIPGNGLVFKFTDVEDPVMYQLRGWGQYFKTDQAKYYREYVRLHGISTARRIQFDGILYPLETMGMVGFHLHAHYGVNQVEPLDIESVPEPLPVGDEMRMSKEDQDRIQTIKDRMGKKPAVIVQRSHFAGDNGDIIVGSSWAP